MAATKRRAKGEGGISRRASGLWVGRITHDGGKVQVTSMDHAELVVKMQKAREQLARYGHVANTATTVTEWTERWLTEIAAPKLRPKTQSTYASLIRKHIQPAIGRKPLVKLTPADIRAVRKAITDTAGLSTTTARQAYRVLSRCLEDARRERLITENVCDRVDAPPSAIVKRGAFTVPQTLTLLRLAAGMPGGSRHIAQLLMGLRQSEALGLTLDDLDLDAGHAVIRWQLQELVYEHTCGPRGKDRRHPCGYKQGARCPQRVWRVPDAYDYTVLGDRLALVPVKSRHGMRTVPIVPFALTAIRRHLQDVAGQPNPHRLVWHDGGRPIRHTADEASWVSLVTAAGLPAECTTHWARHSVATLLKREGVDTLVIGEIVGHGAAQVTEGYIHISSEQAREAMGRLAAALEID